MILGLLLVSALLQDPPVDPEEERLLAVRRPELSQVVGEYARAYFERHPWLAAERKWPLASDSVFGRYGAGQVAWWNDLLEDLERDLDTVVTGDLLPAGRADLTAFAATVEVETILAQGRTSERWDASSYVRRVERSLFALCFERSAPDAERRRRLGGALGELPAHWAMARASLLSPRHEWNERAIEELQHLESFLEQEVAGFWNAEDHGDNTLLAEALDATVAFRAWLADTPASLSGTATTLGRERWEELIHAVSGFDGSLEELEQLLLRELLHYETAYALTGAESPATFAHGPDELVRCVRTAAGAARALASAEDLVETQALGPEELSATLGWLPACSRPVMLLAGEDGALVLRIDPRDSSATTEAGLICLSIQFGLPGEALLIARAREGGRGILRGHLWNRATREGWGLFALDWTLRDEHPESPFAGRADLVLESARIRRIEAARLLTSFEVHAEGYAPEEATEAFRRRSGLDLEVAAREVRCAQIDPLHGIAYLGYLQLRALEGYGKDGEARLRSAFLGPHRRPVDAHQASGRPASR